jgi:hypothetical protein
MKHLRQERGILLRLSIESTFNANSVQAMFGGDEDMPWSLLRSLQCCRHWPGVNHFYLWGI